MYYVMHAFISRRFSEENNYILSTKYCCQNNILSRFSRYVSPSSHSSVRGAVWVTYLYRVHFLVRPVSFRTPSSRNAREIFITYKYFPTSDFKEQTIKKKSETTTEPLPESAQHNRNAEWDSTFVSATSLRPEVHLRHTSVLVINH